MASGQSRHGRDNENMVVEVIDKEFLLLRSSQGHGCLVVTVLVYPRAMQGLKNSLHSTSEFTSRFIRQQG
jgi:hypothetical protein